MIAGVAGGVAILSWIAMAQTARRQRSGQALAVFALALVGIWVR